MYRQQELVELLSGAKRILVVTGAGISTASGIPDFRGPAGVWKRRAPVYHQEFMASEEKRVEYWDYKAEGHPLFSTAKPTPVHEAVVQLERLGRVQALVTQNIDGLHQAAGSSHELVLELHGTNRFVECVRCGALSEPGPAVERFLRERKTPCCDCGGWLKFATISFGQMLRPELLERAWREAEAADLVLAMGSSLSVQPAAAIPLVTARRGNPYIIINQGPTDHDGLADLRLDGNVQEIFPPAVAKLAEGQPEEAIG